MNRTPRINGSSRSRNITIARSFSGRAERAISHNIAESTLDFGSSPLRWAYDALLCEFTALRSEIVSLGEQIERTYSYLLALTGVILASQVVSDHVSRDLGRHPSLYLVSAFAALWFPAHYNAIIIELTSLGTYLREVLYPKINNIIELAVSVASDPQTISLEAMLGWSETVGTVLPYDSHDSIKGPMAWENFNNLVKHVNRPRGVLVWSSFFLRSLLLYAPTVLLLVLYAQSSAQVSLLRIFLLTGIGLGVLQCLLTQVFGGALVYSLKIGIFKPRVS